MSAFLFIDNYGINVAMDRFLYTETGKLNSPKKRGILAKEKTLAEYY